MKTSFWSTLLLLLLASATFAIPLADMPVSVGGYVLDGQGQPISGATITFIDQSSFDEFVGTTDEDGWYGNAEVTGVSQTSSVRGLGQSYPNPTFGSFKGEMNGMVK